jgi:hypothetical protein
MALDYSYELGTSESLRAVAELLCAAAASGDLVDRWVNADEFLAGCRTTHDTWIRVVDGATVYPWNVVEEASASPPRGVWRSGWDMITLSSCSRTT